MFFKMLLLALAKRLEWLAENDPGFQQEISSRICVLQFETRDRKIQRYFSFRAGNIDSRPRGHKNPSVTFIFESSRAARQLVQQMARDPKDMSGFMDAMNQGKIRVRGDISLMVWFMTVSDFLAPDLPELPSLPFLDR